MASKHSFDFSFAKGNPRHAIRRTLESTMRILVMGGFQGPSLTSNQDSLTAGDIHRIDIDNFDRQFAKLEPTLDLVFDESGESQVHLVFREMEDFHPDRLAERDPVLAQLREIKRRLQDPATFQAAAEKLTRMLGANPDKADSVVSPPPSAQETDAETLERLLGAKPRTSPEPESQRNKVADTFIQALVAPHTVPEKPDVSAYRGAADQAAAARLRSLLHHPDYQRLEAGWRSLFDLVSQIESDEIVEVSILTLDAVRLREALANPQGNPLDSPLGRLLTETSSTAPDTEPWTAIVGDYLFDADTGDIRTLSALGAICHRLGIGFFAGAKPALLGCPDLRTHPHPRDWTHLPADAGDALHSLRRSQVAQAIGLALPRVLLRLPYGEESDPCDLFPFEEMPGAPVHDAFLWGNSAFLCVRLLAQAYCENGGQASAVTYGEIGDLPAYIDRQDAEAAMQACAEVYLPESAAEAISDVGFIPALSYKRRNAVRIGPIRSLAMI